MELTYRLALKSDWERLTEFRNKYSEASIDLDRNHFQQDFEVSENQNRGPLFLALQGIKIVGYGRCGFFDPVEGKFLYGFSTEIPKGYYLKSVLTDFSFRGFGVGKQLTVIRNNWMKERSDRIYCILQKTNIPSLKMHEALGYKIIKENLKYQGVENDNSGLLLELAL